MKTIPMADIFKFSLRKFCFHCIVLSLYSFENKVTKIRNYVKTEHYVTMKY
jgi:hypothetical protein